MKVWYYAQLTRKVDLSGFIRMLSHAGVDAYESPEKQPRGPGLVFFDEISPSLLPLVRELSHNGVERVVLIFTNEAPLNRSSVWQLLRAGASDLLPWFPQETLAPNIQAKFTRWEHVDSIAESPVVQENLVGRSKAWVSVMRRVIEIAVFTDSAVLITGESGTGKELVARLIHRLDRRPGKKELILIDCASVARDLSLSEFFGHERGAFTGAITSRDGAFALADGGTLFLDEVGELPLAMQAELLRAVQEHTYKRIGSNSWHEAKFRLICATNHNLMEETVDGRFRSDLYYRLAASTFRLPALCERAEDIVPLSQHFVSKLVPENTPEISEEVREYLLAREYPGNVRDLQQLLFRIISRHVGNGPITVGDVPPDERPSAQEAESHWVDESFQAAIRRALVMGCGLKEIGRMAEDIAVGFAIESAGGNLRRAAQQLKVTERAIQMRRAAARKGQARARDSAA